jgi:signal transduction histidine kinase
MASTLEQLEYMHSSFVVNVSHELKTPMTTILGFVGGILDGTIPEDKHKYYLSIVAEEIERLSRLINAMLNLSRLQSGNAMLQMSRFDLDLVLQTTVLSMEPIITEKQLDVIGLDCLEKSTMTADNNLIHQAVYNLIENAVKFADIGGYIKIGLDPADDGYNIIIENSGKGIGKEELALIFERFYKTDKSRSIDKKGVGLGLYLVKTIVQLHGGYITADSELDKFTRFTVFLPKKQR